MEIPWKPITTQRGSLSAALKRWQRRWGIDLVGVRGRRRGDEEAQMSECEKREGRKGKDRES